LISPNSGVSFDSLFLFGVLGAEKGEEAAYDL